jgi:coenzyme F420-dependent glucose-6-phosphate dehydrogenase
MLRIGYKASAEQFAPRELLEFSQHAERVGFDSVFVSDHLQPWRHHGGHAPAALPWLGALAASTERIAIGTSVLTPTLRYHPAIIAQAFATLGCLAPGRIILGVGSGESLNEMPLEQHWPETKERSARLLEAVQLIKRLWQEDRVDFDGTYYHTHKATIYDKPEQPVALYLAAGGPLAARRAGRIGDGLICTSGKGRELYAETLLPSFAEGATKAGRDAGDLDTMIEMKVSFDTDEQRALDDTHHWAALALSSDEKTGVHDPIEMERLADALPVERTAGRWIVSTDPDEHVARIKDYVDLGFRHLVFHAPGQDQKRFLDLYARDVLPRLRALDIA